jgi:hypothetical protein
MQNNTARVTPVNKDAKAKNMFGIKRTTTKIITISSINQTSIRLFLIRLMWS